MGKKINQGGFVGLLSLLMVVTIIAIAIIVIKKHGLQTLEMGESPWEPASMS